MQMQDLLMAWSCTTYTLSAAAETSGSYWYVRDANIIPFLQKSKREFS